MLKKLLPLCLCLVFLTSTAAVFAEDVHATKRGKKYHKEACRFVKGKDTQEIAKKAAVEKGLKPCGRCYKEDIAVKEDDKGEKLSKVSKKTDSSVIR